MKKIFLGLMACAALCACTSDDLVSLGNETQKTFDGDVAYMTVRLNDVGTGTRATSSGYKNGSESEYAVSTAHFYFYDAAGVYVSEASVWDSGNAVSGDGNIEFKSETVIVLEGLTGKGYPTYVVTVLNKPTSFKPGETLDEMATLLSDAASEGITTSVTPSGGTATDYFTMSTSSYVGTAPYFATVLTEKDFYEEPVSTTDTPVEIYVERLAAKVQLGIDDDLAATETTLNDGSKAFKLTETVGGDPNNEGDVDEGATEVYVKLLGWALNGTAKHSLMMKDVTPFVSSGEAQAIDGWAATDWNIASDHRSYWGASFNYGLGTYPKTSEGASNAAGSEKTGEDLNDYLDYVSYNDLKLDVEGGYEYCAENTNTAAILGSKNSSGITHVLIAAEACDIDGNPLDLVRYQGELFEVDSYLDYVMSELTYGGSLNVYTATETSEGTTYTHIDGSSYIQLVNAYDGYVTVGLVENAFSTGTYYKNNGDGTFTAYADADAVTSAVTTELNSFNTLHPSVNAYTGGKMYYSIPIEHLNNTYPTEGSTPSINEANYGIVRNHWYLLTITSLENLGKGVYDPDEVIIPNIDDEQYYYVGANINILSWKLVEQSVDL